MLFSKYNITHSTQNNSTQAINPQKTQSSIISNLRKKSNFNSRIRGWLRNIFCGRCEMGFLIRFRVSSE
jgi:hypothetical protein